VPPELHGELVTMLAICWVGDLTAGERAVRPLRTFRRPLADLITPMPYTALQSASDAAYPAGQHNYWKSHYIDAITDEVIGSVLEHAPRMCSPLSSFYFQHLGGAISRNGTDHAAFGHRNATFDFAILTVWRDPGVTDENLTWARDFFAALQPHATGVYVNNLGSEGADRVKAAYAPETYERLVTLKERYDPSNILRLNQNISPRQRSS
jgi:FAD/FMN-containing dehydrogenase